MDIEQARFNMVEQQIRTWAVLDQNVLDLLFVIRREEFVPPAYRMARRPRIRRRCQYVVVEDGGARAGAGDPVRRDVLDRYRQRLFHCAALWHGRAGHERDIDPDRGRGEGKLAAGAGNIELESAMRPGGEAPPTTRSC
jgi:hypothetical protein